MTYITTEKRNKELVKLSNKNVKYFLKALQQGKEIGIANERKRILELLQNEHYGRRDIIKMIKGDKK